MKKNYSLAFFISLFTFAVIGASQEEGVSFFYDEKTNTEWICGKQLFSKLVIDEPTKNHVFFGAFSSSSDIDVNVKNLIIIGSLVCANTIDLKIRNDFFNAGSITAETLNIEAGETVYNGLSDGAIAKIQALGIDISFGDTEHKRLKVVKPSRN